MASVIFSQAGGKVFASDGKASELIHNQEVYALKDITAEIANKMPLYFYDFTGDVKTPVKVVYSSDSKFSAGTTESVVMNGVTDFKEIDELSKQRDDLQKQIDEKNERYLYLLELQEQIDNQ